MRSLGTKVLSRSGRRAHRSGWALGALALGAFAIGTAELVVVGILNLVAKGEHVSVSSAGQLVTAYALGIAVGAPLVTALTARAGRRSLLCAALGLFIAGNALAAAATSFHVLLLARVLTGSLHGLFIGVACVIAASLVPPQRRGSAISMVFGGIAVSTVVGVPAGTLIGHAAGWRAAFLAVVALATVALISSAVLIPHMDAAEPVRLRSQARAAFAPRVLATLALGFVLIGGQFIAFTYLTALLQRVTHVAGGAVSGFLLIFGIAAAVGAGVGGKAADRSTAGTLLAANLGVVIALKFLDLFRTSPLLVAVWLGAWGFATFAIVPAFQLWVITLAGEGADLAATLGASAVNGGIAVGSLLGGAVLADHGPSAPLVVALGVSAAAIPLTAGVRFIQEPVLERERRRSSPSAAPVDDHRGA